MLTIILPCYNPPTGWDDNILFNYKEVVKRLQCEVEIILVNDGSEKLIDSGDIDKLKSHISNFQYIDNAENRGKGYAIRCGVAVAKGSYIIYTDIDFPYSVDSMIAIYNNLEQDKCDIAAGIKSSEYYNSVPRSRKFISKGLQLFTKTLLSLPISDTQCGLKGFKQFVKPIFQETTVDRYLFDIEFLRIAYKKKCRVIAVPVALNEDVVFRKMSYKILFPEMLNFIKLLFK